MGIQTATEGYVRFQDWGFEMRKWWNGGSKIVFVRFISFSWSFMGIEAMYLEEKAWVSSDYRFATITNGYLSKSKFSIVLESKIVKNDRVGSIAVREVRCRVSKRTSSTSLNSSWTAVYFRNTMFVTFTRTRSSLQRRYDMELDIRAVGLHQIHLRAHSWISSHLRLVERARYQGHELPLLASAY